MSSAVISTSAAPGRFFIFDAKKEDVEKEGVQKNCAERENAVCLGNHRFSPADRIFSLGCLPSTIDNRKSKILSTVTPASRLSVRPAPEMVSSGIAALDALAGGFPRGCLTEIFGPASSGRTTILLAALASATQRGEVCALVDATDALDPHSLAAANIDLNRLLWVRCADISPQSHRDPEKKKTIKNLNSLQNESCASERRLEQLLRVTDLLLESGGFGLVALDFCDLPPQIARRIPLATWFRFRRVIEHTPAVLLAFEQQSTAGSCSSLLIKLGSAGNRRKELTNFQPMPNHAQLLTGLDITVEVLRSRMDRKSVRSAETTFFSQTAWAG